jgi:ribose transport system permease protein
MRYTRWGRHVYAIGSNEQTARLCGVNVSRTKILVYAVSGLFAGIAGVIAFAKLGQGDVTTAEGLELNVIAAVVLGGASLNGGQGSVFGTLVGALIMTVIANGCSKLGMRNSDQKMLTGAIIVLAVAIDRFQHRRK